MTSVTVAIPCYGQADTLDRALESALAQTWPALEVIVVDDGSPPDEASEIAGICTGHTDVRLVQVTNRGLAGARNVALMLAEGDAFLPLDADDWIDEHYIEKTVPLLKNADVVVPGLQEHGPTRNGTYGPGFDRRIEDVTLDVMWQYNRCYYASLYRAKMLRCVGGWNAKMTLALEDYDLHVDLMMRGARYVGCYETLFHYQTKDDSMLQRAHQTGGYEQMVAEMKRHHRYGDAPQPIQGVPRAKTVEEARQIRSVGLSRLRDSLDS
jgi:glycosyltransferase involved in cell wall biosynthesis